MDDDHKFVRELKARLKALRARLSTPEYGRVLTSAAAELELSTGLEREGVPFLAGRIGSTEARLVQKYCRGTAYADEDVRRIHELSGVFPLDGEALDEFAEIYVDAIREVDVLGVWYPEGEGYFIQKEMQPEAALVPLGSLEPYYSNQPWSRALKGKHVVVVHPFEASILSQYGKRASLFEAEVLPEFASLRVVRAVQTIAGSKCAFDRWAEALRHMTDRIDEADYDVALIGAGAYGLPRSS